MNLLFIGDVVGRNGRRVVERHLPQLVSEHEVEMVIINAENAAGGFGLTRSVAEQLFKMDAHVLTTGNHVWDKREILEFIDQEPAILRPLNYPSGTPGHGYCIVPSAAGEAVAVVNLMGQVFMPPMLDNPFHAMDALLPRIRERAKIIFVDFHAEATSEKQGMGWYLDGRVTAVIGTHTHVPTTDTRVLPGGTAFQSDAGMTGCYHSIIGMDVNKSIKRFVDTVPERMEVAAGAATLCGVLVSVDPASGLSTGIQRIRVGAEL